MSPRRLAAALSTDWRALSALGAGTGAGLGLAAFLLLDAWR